MDEKEYLSVDDVYTLVTEEDLKNLSPIVEDFIDSYEKNQEKPIEEWLSEKLQSELPEKSSDEVRAMANEIVESVRTFENKKESLNETLVSGRSKESWFEGEVKKATSRMSVEQTVQYYQGLDNAVKSTKEVLINSIFINEGQTKLQEDLYNEKWNVKFWNEYKAKDIVKDICKQSAQAALLGTAIGITTEEADKYFKGKKIEGKEVAKKVIAGVVDFCIKVAIAGAIKTGAEKGIIKCIPKGTPVGVIASVVFAGVENAKILYKYGKGEISGNEALTKMEETTVSTFGAMVAMGYGAAKGAAVGLAFGGPVGAAVGGFVGGTIAYMAGAALGKVVVETRRKIYEKISSVIGRLKIIDIKVCQDPIDLNNREFERKLGDIFK